jgi:hypothetical protein
MVGDEMGDGKDKRWPGAIWYLSARAAERVNADISKTDPDETPVSRDADGRYGKRVESLTSPLVWYKRERLST